MRLYDHKGKCCSFKVAVEHVRVQLTVNRNLLVKESLEMFLSVSIAERSINFLKNLSWFWDRSIPAGRVTGVSVPRMETSRTKDLAKFPPEPQIQH